MPDGIDITADALAAAARDSGDDRFTARVDSVNADGTVSLTSGFGARPSVKALASYSPRAVGDTVLAVQARQGPIVVGKVGGPQAGVGFTLSDSSAPGGQGWEEVVSGAVWAKTSGAMWLKRLVASAPASSVTLSATQLVTYRGGVQSQTDRAEQGDYSGRGLQTGLGSGFGSWAGLSGHSATGGTLTMHRRAEGHGFTYDKVAAYAYPCLAATAPTTTPALIGDPVQLQLKLNETGSVLVPASWAQPFCAGTATAVAIYSGTATDNLEVDAMTLTVTY